ncbi:undecaprenyl-phosphate glucose phosphotransferase [Thiomicrorhabdus sp. ZW0627]|uniref:undecaprenyl-phosphate glucose phosphotransferase n=1 Tax=Thiomicrorhabdus sp. ZW0627 TaxID=3039774 RepID=UPI00243739FC|nr:undecaprenyl-phosphate glucose phosphotransferase [Thiomicrorhabdus sp. ZW0627]MDG6773612.1 undecaprenyl-phosphate glucose phosphotransferase [Thiomicrorhabdus sp. ZW0627]
MNIQTDSSGFVWLHRFIDLVIPYFILMAIANYIFDVPIHDRYTIMGILGGFVFVTSAQMVGTYQNWRGRPFFNSMQLVLKAWVITWGILIIVAFLYKDASNYSRMLTVLWAIATPLVLIGYRLFLRLVLSYYRMQGNNYKEVAIVGAGKVGQHLAAVIQKNLWLGYKVIGFYDDNTELKNRKIVGTPVLGTIEQVYNDAKSGKFDELYICLPLRAENKIKLLLNQLTDTTTVVKYIPDLFSFDLMHAKWTDLKGIPVISVYDTPLNSTTAKLLKRMEDLVISSIILLLISPMMIILAIAVKVTSPGPIIFKQKRYGHNGQEIKVYKFRSMTTQDNGAKVKQATKNDLRFTPIGAFLRKTSLDELPQFINVLQGKMSIVGPRPHAVAHNEEYRQLVPKYMQRHLVKPGITGWAQINGWRGETDTLEKMEKRVEYDLHYINNWSLWLDIKIIVLTIFKGFINKNAY